MEPHHEAALRSVGTACQTAARALLAGLDSKTVVGLEDGIRAAEGALGRAQRQLDYLRRRLPSHSRAVRLSSKAVQRGCEALSAAEPPEEGWPDPDASRVAQAALRASQLILVGTDGGDAFAAAGKRQAG